MGAVGTTGRLVRGTAAGALVWTAAEYGVHRWLMHGRHTANPVTAEHLDHHRHLERTDPLRFDRFLWWPAAGAVAVGVPARAITTGATAAGAGLGFAFSYCGYRHLHWSIHHRPPRTSWGRRLRRHHLRHHVGAPRANHGVTTPLWDLVLGTYQRDDGPVRLPAGMAPGWLVGADGRSRPHWASDYRLR